MLLAGVKRSGACGPGLGQAPKRAKMFRERLNPVNMYGGGPFYTKGTSAANSVSDLFRSRFYNRGEIGSLQSGAADEAAVHVRLGYQLVGVLGVHGAAVLNGNAVGGFLVVQAGDHPADLGADLYRAFGECVPLIFKVE